MLLIPAAHAGVPLLIANGDSDTYIPPLSTRGWIESLRLPLANASERIRPWTDAVTSQTAGHIVAYKDLTWVNVRWTGHHIALAAPAKAQQLVSAFVNGRLAQLR